MEDYSSFGFESFDAPETQASQTGLYIPEARECMRCGQCVAGCPTYKVSQEEAETPRARLRSIAKLLVDGETLEEAAQTHLLNCLQCRACETVCPSRVDYGALFGQANQRLAEQSTGPWLGRQLQRAALYLVESKPAFRCLGALLRFYQKSGLRALLRRSGLLQGLRLKSLDDLLPTLQAPFPHRHYPAKGEAVGSVALFTGCLAATLDSGTSAAAVRVLNRLGYHVIVPEQQVCCGALHQHLGKTQPAHAFARQNIEVFNALEVDAVLYSASGCGLMLAEYAQLAELAEVDGLQKFCDRLREISGFLNEITWPSDFQLQPLAQKVAVHDPCSLRHTLKSQDAVYQLLARIPALTLEALPDNQMCCGAGGSHMVTHPDIARPLRDEKLDALAGLGADILVSSNIGCALHLASGLRDKAGVPEVIHPVALLDRQSG